MAITAEERARRAAHAAGVARRAKHELHAQHVAGVARREKHDAGVARIENANTREQKRYDQQLIGYNDKLRDFNRAAQDSAISSATTGRGFYYGKAPIAPAAPKLRQVPGYSSLSTAGQKKSVRDATSRSDKRTAKQSSAASAAASPATPAFSDSTYAYTYSPPSFAGGDNGDDITAGDVAQAELDTEGGAGPAFNPWLAGGAFVGLLVLYAWAHGARR